MWYERLKFEVEFSCQTVLRAWALRCRDVVVSLVVP